MGEGKHTIHDLPEDLVKELNSVAADIRTDQRDRLVACLIGYRYGRNDVNADLLAALEEMVDVDPDKYPTSDAAPIYRARAAIARAKGE